MMEEKIELTQQELEELKDDIKFKTKTTLTLKHVCSKLDNLNDIPKKMSVLETKVGIQWWFIGVILIVLGFGVRWMLK